MEKILIVEDDIIIGGGIKLFLESKGYKVVLAASIAEAKAALASTFDLMILDHNLPDGTGLSFCMEFRKKSNLPIIFLTANDTSEDMIKGFEAGCDDYIAKPFVVELLYQRILAVLRRSQSTASEKEMFRYKSLSVDFDKKQVFLDDKIVKLSATEYKLLELLIKNRGQVLTRDSILSLVWDIDENFIDENTLNVHIRRLRQKVEADSKNPEYIITVFGIGYTFGE